MVFIKSIINKILNKNISLSNHLINFVNKKKKFLPYREALISFLKENLKSPKGKILDIGSGTWPWTKDWLSKKEGCKVISFDKVKTDNVDIIGDLYDINNYFDSNSFDLIVCTDVIEHVPKPFEAIEKISSVLKPNKTILLSCPFDKNLHGEDYGDYWRITRQGWKELLKNNFKDIEIKWLGEELKPKAYFIKAIKK